MAHPASGAGSSPAGGYGNQNLPPGALKATARIPDELSDRATNPVNFATTGDSLQAVKATVRMNPQETMNAVANHAAKAAASSMAGQPPPSNQGHPSSGSRIPDLSFQQTGYGHLQPGSWTEPTVVKRKPNVGEKETIVGALQGLSGTTGLLIGIGLGLGIAAGLLIAFLLARG